jgi:hypothetical protein
VSLLLAGLIALGCHLANKDVGQTRVSPPGRPPCKIESFKLISLSPVSPRNRANLELYEVCEPIYVPLPDCAGINPQQCEKNNFGLDEFKYITRSDNDRPSWIRFDAGFLCSTGNKTGMYVFGRDFMLRVPFTRETEYQRRYNKMIDLMAGTLKDKYSSLDELKGRFQKEYSELRLVEKRAKDMGQWSD